MSHPAVVFSLEQLSSLRFYLAEFAVNLARLTLRQKLIEPSVFPRASDVEVEHYAERASPKKTRTARVSRSSFSLTFMVESCTSGSQTNQSLTRAHAQARRENFLIQRPDEVSIGKSRHCRRAGLARPKVYGAIPRSALR